MHVAVNMEDARRCTPFAFIPHDDSLLYPEHSSCSFSKSITLGAIII